MWVNWYVSCIRRRGRRWRRWCSVDTTRAAGRTVKDAGAIVWCRRDRGCRGVVWAGYVDEHDFGGFDRVVVGEAEAEAVGLVCVNRVTAIEDTDVHVPFTQVQGRDQGQSRWEGPELELGW